MPKNFENLNEHDLRELMIESETNAGEDAEAIVSSASHRVDHATDLEGKKVKEEQQTEEVSEIDKMNQQIQPLLMDPRPVYDEFTTMSVQAKKIIQGDKADSDKDQCSEALIKDTQALETKATRLQKLLQRLLAEKPGDLL